MTPPRRFELDREAALAEAARLVTEAWSSFDQSRPGQPEPSGATRALAALGLPEGPSNVADALAEAEHVLDESIAQPRPRYFAFIGSSGLEAAVLGDLLAAAYDVNLAVNAHAADLIEEQALRWLGELVGYPVASGSFTSGGMVSNLTALAAARERALPGARHDGLAGRKTAVYCSVEAHYSVQRAAELLGIGSSAVRRIAIDQRRRMQPQALRAAIEADSRLGVMPIAVVATAGTTLTGAVDPLDRIADICAERGVWMHVDGAYGLPAAAATSTRAFFRGLDRADSVSVDAHKWLFVPKACSAVMVRDRAALSRAFSHHEAYMLHDEGDEAEHGVDRTLEYSRPFRALKLWLALRTYGAGAFRAAIEQNLAQARLLARLVHAAPDLELLAEPMLTVVPFRRIPAQGSADEHNLELARRLQDDGRIWVSDAMVDGKVCLRPCIVNYRTTDEDVAAIVAVARELGAELDAAG